jgi:cytidylate kinase
MAIITISRELAALGDETGAELAKLINWKLVDKFLLEERIKGYGQAAEKAEKFEERRPGLFASLSSDRDAYIHYMKQAMMDFAAEGDCVFMGRGASVIFSGMPGLLSVFLVSNADIRVKRVKSYFHCDDKRAHTIIAQSDNDKTGYHKYFFETDWKNPDNYLITLNTSYLSPASCSRTIELIHSHVFDAETGQRSALYLNEMILAQKVVGYVMYEKKIGIHFFEASVTNDTTTLFGVAKSQALVDTAIATAKEVAGVQNVVSEIQVVPEYNILP